MVRFFSGEWMLEWPRPKANGGGVVAARSLWSGSLIYLVFLVVHEIVDPTDVMRFSIRSLRELVLETYVWYGGLVGGTYAALYARFSSQWTYLANLYNQIKAAEIGSPDSDTANSLLSMWKAGFIEDSDDLHLSEKPIFASVIREWGKEEEIKTEFKEFCVGGAARFNRIISRAKEACAEREKKFNAT